MKRLLEILFEIETPLNTKIRTTRKYWNYLITIKHPVMRGKEKIVASILKDPDEVRKSKIDENVYLYYKTVDRMYCAVAKHENETGFLITTYPVDKLKEGEIVWKK